MHTNAMEVPPRCNARSNVNRVAVKHVLSGKGPKDISSTRENMLDSGQVLKIMKTRSERFGPENESTKVRGCPDNVAGQRTCWNLCPEGLGWSSFCKCRSKRLIAANWSWEQTVPFLRATLWAEANSAAHPGKSALFWWKGGMRYVRWNTLSHQSRSLGPLEDMLRLVREVLWDVAFAWGAQPTRYQEVHRCPSVSNFF